MRINHNISAMNTYRQYNINSTSIAKSMEKLSSGYRINRAADDAAGLSISEKMRSQIRGLRQAIRNAQDGISFLQTAEGALTEVSDMLTRLKELAVQAQNGTYSEEDKANIGAEMKALGNAIVDIYKNTKFNGINVFGDPQDDNTNNTLTTGSGFITIYYGENGEQSVKIEAAPINTTGLGGLISATFEADTNPTGVTTEIVEGAISEVNTTRAKYGALQNQLEHASNNMATTRENLQAAESRIRDVDMAEEMMEYTKNNILLQAAQAMLAQANAQPQGILQLLQ
ncbi:MAG TPA: flagellin [Bacillota bacterium]|nr:flagellin [Bacillota bacterium]